jgi:hypothetical protein
MIDHSGFALRIDTLQLDGQTAETEAFDPMPK